MTKSIDPVSGEEIEDYSQIDEYKKAIFDELFNLTYYGNGGWNWNLSYNLPIHIRRYCLKLLNQAKERESDAINKKNVADENTSGIPKIPKSVYDALNVERRPPKQQ